MTKKDLKSYIRWKHTIAGHEEELRSGDLDTLDTVKGSAHEHPYIERTLVIHGRNVMYEDWLREEIVRLREKCARVEKYIDGVQDDEMRAMLRMHYVQGDSWTKVRRKMRIKHVSSNALQKRAIRFLEKKF